MTKGRLLPFRTGDPALDSLLLWAVRERPEVLVRWGQRRIGFVGQASAKAGAGDGLPAEASTPAPASPDADVRSDGVLVFSPLWERNWGRWLAACRPDASAASGADRAPDPGRLHDDE